MTAGRVVAGGKKRFDVALLTYYAAMALMLLASVWIRSAFPVYAIGPAAHDDALFIKLAASIGAGDWLGEYDNLTHAKGVGYPLFLALNDITGLPLKFSEHLLYLLSALLFAAMLGAVCKSRWASLLAFTLLAFVPTAWNAGVGGRVIREGLYVSQSLMILALAVRCFVLSNSDSSWQELREKWWFLVLLGFLAGFYWLTREEGVWLLPSVAVLFVFWLWSRRRVLSAWRPSVLFVVLPLIPFLLIVGTVNTLNYHWYGVFRNNDFRSPDFVSAYGALSRIKHDKWQRFVAFPKDARQRAFRFSAAAKELKPSLEGVLGLSWQREGCANLGITPCTEIPSGWFMWALRDSVAAAGHYRSATEARSFYTRLASEINAGCDRYPDECLAARRTMVPPWRHNYAVDTVAASWGVFRTLVTLGDAPITVSPSVGNHDELELFQKITNGPLASPDNVDHDTYTWPDAGDVRVLSAGILARAEKWVATFGIPLALVALLPWCLIAIHRRRPSAVLVLALALAVAVGMRVLLLGFLEATSIPSNNMLYLSPVVPMALALIPAVLFGVSASADSSARPVEGRR